MVKYVKYILISEVTDRTYVGVSINIKKRLAQHNAGKSNYTSKYKPWKVFYTEEYDQKEKAYQREKWFKSRSGRRFMKKLFSNAR